MARNLTLGTKGRDVVTGFTGILTGRATYLTGCDQYSLTGTADEKGSAPSIWFDENRIEIIDEKPLQLVGGDSLRGGPVSFAAPIK